MQILVNSDHHIHGSESLTERVESIVRDSLGRFGGRITRIEVHLNDVNGDKLGERDKRCMMEARLAGLKPIAVSHQAPSLLEAIDAAADKLARAIEHVLGKAAAAGESGPGEEQVATIDRLDEVEKVERARTNGASH
jgi:ribosome-associated translation inhibitor RaiA